jgi:galactonate dehydratase
MVAVETDDGIVGFGEGEGTLVARAAEGFTRQNRDLLFVGKDTMRPEALKRSARLEYYERWGYGQVTLGVLGAVESACYDIMGKVLGVSSATLLGGRVWDRIRVYANGWYTAAHSPQEWGDAARAAVEEHGYTALKFDPFGWTYRFADRQCMRRAVERISAVRSAVGEDVDINIEGHGRFAVAEAVKVGKAITEFRPMWFEAPIHNFLGPEAHLQVKAQLTVPIASDLAGVRDRYECLAFCSVNAVDVLQPDVRDNGGVSETKFMAEIAETFGISFAPHQANGPVGAAVQAQIDSTCTNFLIQEDFEHFANPRWFDEVFPVRPIMDRSGYLTLPSGPGWGVEVDVAAARRYPWDDKWVGISVFREGWERRNVDD